MQVEIKAGQSVKAGWIFKNADNDWRNAPVDGSVPALELWWLEIDVDLTNSSVNKTIEAYGDGAEVIGEVDGAIPVGSRVKTSVTAAHNGQMQAHAVPTVADEGDTSTTDLGAEIAAAIQAVYTFNDDTVGYYKGHEDEVAVVGANRTDAADEDPGAVFVIRRGA